jgi:hypothetical protein
MIKTAALAAALAIGLATAGYAQTTGPAGQSSTEQKSGNMGPNSGTTGASSGGGSGMTSKGGANGNPAMAPKTTTGPAGAASKTESPPK